MAEESRAESYAPRFFEEIAAVEDRHFWFRSRRRVVRALVRRHSPPTPGAVRVLDAGIGTGMVAADLASLPRLRLFGLDSHIEGLLTARRRSAAIRLLNGDLERPPFVGCFDLVLCLDVIEHLDDDVAALVQMGRALAPGGRLIVTVPAVPRLWSAFDVASHHRRRYGAALLASRLSAADFEIDFLSPFMCALLPAAWLARRRRGGQRPMAKDRPTAATYAAAIRELRVRPAANAIFFALLRTEAGLLAAGRRLPFGTSLVAVARYRSTPRSR